MGFLSREVFKQKFDRNKISEIHTFLLNEIPEARLIWKNQKDIKTDPVMAEKAIIEVQGKMLFQHDGDSMKGFVDPDVIPGRKNLIYDALRHVSYIEQTPSYEKGILLGILYFVLIGIFSLTWEREAFILMGFCIVFMIVCTVFHYYTLNKQVSDGTNQLARALNMFSLVILALLSLLFLPLFNNMCYQRLYNKVNK